MKYLDDHVGFVFATFVVIVALAVGVLVAEYTGITDGFINSFN